MQLKQTYKKTELGLLPYDWELKKLNEICSPSKERIDPQTTLNEYKCIELEHISPDTGRILGYANSRNLRSQKTVFRKGNILFGKLRPYLRKYLYTDFEGVCSTEIWALIPEKNINSRWLFYLLQSDRVIESANQSVGTKMPRAEWKVVGSTLVYFPPNNDEQAAIANVLFESDVLISNLEKTIDKKRKIMQGAMSQLLQPKDNWQIEPIKNFATINTGAKNTQDKVENGVYPFFVRSQKVERINSFSYEGEAVLVAGDGVGTGKVIHYFKGKFDYHQRVYKISEFKENIRGYYFYLYFRNNFLNRVIQLTAKSSVDSIRMEMIAEMRIPFPNTNEQIRIARILSEMESEIKLLESKLDKYRQIKQGMMQSLLTGKVRLI